MSRSWNRCVPVARRCGNRLPSKATGKRCEARGNDSQNAALAEVESSLQFDDAINIQYTSGTTGFPKGATLSHHNILNNAYFIGRQLGYTEADRVCIPVPFYHCFGMVLANLACTSHGACMVVPGESYDPLAVLETVQAERCTSLYGVPTMFIGDTRSSRASPTSMSRRCEPASWPAPPARSN